MSDFKPDFPMDGTITATDHGWSANIDGSTMVLQESENGDWLQRAADRAAREYGEGVEVEVTFYATGDGWDCGEFRLHGPVDGSEGNGGETA